MASVVITYLHRDEIDSVFVTCLQAMVNHDAGTHILDVIDARSGPMIAAGRNQLVAAALAYPECEWVLMLDDDMGFDRDTLERMLAVADPKGGIPVVGGLAFCGGRSGQVVPTLKRLDPETNALETVWQFQPDTLEPVDATGAACMLVHRDVYETVAAHFERPYDWAKFGGDEVGEDIQFCLRMRALKIPIHVHTGIQFSHWKKQPIDLISYIEYRKAITELGEDGFHAQQLARQHSTGRSTSHV